MNEAHSQFLCAMAERIADALDRIAEALTRPAFILDAQGGTLPVGQFKIDGQVARPATTQDLEKGKPITVEDIRATYDAMMKALRPIHRDAAQKAMLDAQNKYPGQKMSEWPAKARADLLRALKNIDPLDDEIPF